MPRGRLLLALCAVAVLGGACGDDGDDSSGARSPATGAPATAGFDPQGIYRRSAPGVVTVHAVSPAGRSLGSGFVVSRRGEIVTNAHVVTEDEPGGVERTPDVYVHFADGNRVRARIVGTDPHADIALLRVRPAGLRLRPLRLGSSGRLSVGAPVAAIGSPFGQDQSLTLGVISALDRTIDALTDYEIPGAIQTDAAINSGNSGGPLVDAGGRVIGVTAQLRTAEGDNDGVGFAVPIDAVKRSLAGLRATGRAKYAYLGITSVTVFPQLGRRFGLGAEHGAWVQEVTPGGPAADAGLRGGRRDATFQEERYVVGGDVIVRAGGRAVRDDGDLTEILAAARPGQRMAFAVRRGGAGRTVVVRLGTRPR